MSKYTFPCGCEFEIVDEAIKDNDGLPGLHIDYENIPTDCPATWELIDSGHTKGIFQLETNLGRKWSKQLSPDAIIEMSALISLIRPGSLRVIVDGKPMPEIYCDRKNLGEEVKYFHEALEPILKETYGVLTYQEQSMRIAQDLAGFNLQEADVLRKAIGKKKADIMAKVKTQFLEGCKKVGKVTEEEAEEIFSWIQESQRYSFNKSHGVTYGLIGYWTAYVKAHFPLHFYTSWLYYSHEKQEPQEEMQLLVSDARYFDIDIRPPDLTCLKMGDVGHFSLYKDVVRFGIGDIKKIGDSLVVKVKTNVENVEEQLGRTIDKWTWLDFLIFFSDTVSVTAINGLIAAGATDYMRGSRFYKLHEYELWKRLTQNERNWIKENCKNVKSIIDAMSKLIEEKPRLSVTRKAKIADIMRGHKQVKFSLEDDVSYIAGNEHELLGVPITCTKLATCDNSVEANTTCKEFLQGKGGNMTIAVEIVDANEYIIKKGKNTGAKMMFVSAEDDTASLDSVVVFSNILEGNEPLLIKGSTLLLGGKRDSKGESFIVDSVTQI